MSGKADLEIKYPHKTRQHIGTDQISTRSTGRRRQFADHLGFCRVLSDILLLEDSNSSSFLIRNIHVNAFATSATSKGLQQSQQRDARPKTHRQYTSTIGCTLLEVWLENDPNFETADGEAVDHDDGEVHAWLHYPRNGEEYGTRDLTARFLISEETHIDSCTTDPAAQQSLLSAICQLRPEADTTCFALGPIALKLIWSEPFNCGCSLLDQSAGTILYCACPDRDDDVIIELKSTAILFGAYVRHWHILGIFDTIFVHAPPVLRYWRGWSCHSVHPLADDDPRSDPTNQADCAKTSAASLQQANGDLGFILSMGIAAGLYLPNLLQY
ncbi:uncharacterized protein C8Q71DRAFT_721347 [Rhodofomes roseus]|uniref:Uncharacterized protein n=1 Tax=Rhodofomes roseus TaxID=34475 RepID=A0ABQ8KQJ7_9APHY|nr:uncharacterized protein C8Q71DRAFT_721347 [Rhodofomes roseus]KAH9840908.1 hypothetical protein C8Q71DRAFT_721347 [Rhodofomes roseus]